MNCTNLTTHLQNLQIMKRDMDLFLRERKVTDVMRITEEIGCYFEDMVPLELTNKFFREPTQENYNKEIERIQKKLNNKEKLDNVDLDIVFDVKLRCRLNQLHQNGLGNEATNNLASLNLDLVKDVYSVVTGIKPEEISSPQKMDIALNGGSKYHISYLDLSGYEENGEFILPRIVQDSVYMPLKKFKKIILPREIGHDLMLYQLRRADYIKFPQKIGKSLRLDDVITARGAILPDYVGGDVVMEDLKDADGLIFPAYVGGKLDLKQLKSAKGMTLPRHIKKGLILGIKSIKGLHLPERVEGKVYLFNLSIKDRLKLKELRPDLNFHK